MRSLLLAAVLCTVLCVGALAADSEPVKGGIYGITGSAMLTPDTAATTQTVDGKEYTDYYANAVKFGVAANSLEDNQQYLLLVLKGEGVPTAENIAYIDQAAAQNGSVSFTAYPKELTKGTYHVYLVGGGTAFNSANPAATFQYDKKYKLGDVDENNRITTSDAVEILQSIVGKKTLTETQRLAADVDGNNSITAGDAVYILQFIVGKSIPYDLSND
jgi:hypothetical protein